jgi:hypothetical protein
MLSSLSINHLARDHLEMAPIPTMPVADVAAIKPDHDRIGWLRRVGGMLLHDGLAHPHHSVPHRAGMLRAAHRQQLGQQGGDLAEGDQRRIAGRDVGQFRRDGIPAEVQDGKALGPIAALAGANEQPSDAQRHVAEQRPKPHRIVTFAGQYAAAAHAGATTFTQMGHLCRHHLSLQRCRDLLGLFEPQTQLGQVSVFITFDPGDFRLRRHARLQFCNQLHPPQQLHHPLTLVT